MRKTKCAQTGSGIAENVSKWNKHGEYEKIQFFQTGNDVRFVFNMPTKPEANRND